LFMAISLLLFIHRHVGDSGEQPGTQTIKL